MSADDGGDGWPTGPLARSSPSWSCVALLPGQFPSIMIHVSAVPPCPIPDHIVRPRAGAPPQPWMNCFPRTSPGVAQSASLTHCIIVSDALRATCMCPALIGAGGTELRIDPSGQISSIGASSPSVYGRSPHTMWPNCDMNELLMM